MYILGEEWHYWCLVGNVRLPIAKDKLQPSHVRRYAIHREALSLMQLAAQHLQNPEKMAELVSTCFNPYL